MRTSDPHPVTLSVRVTAHWANGWLLRAFARPFLVVDGVERPVRWAEPAEVEAAGDVVRLGAGVRYRRADPLGGCEPETLELGGAEPPREVELRNGFLNHTPFRVVRRR
ncbi:hypothetical protein NBM05_07720 [Rothia sp. AR01]|uniref:Uncharacterized protein n=1 Tax=Rothia santali TaxID=2949643 RepID=A0A9X2HHP0_9MICC|nr:hypothetical protein [Rothia santali]MCP3425896.1 hypothetical protein [Rothia santali]